MSKNVTHLVLEIDLTHYAEDARVAVAKHFVSKALHSGILSPDDLALFCDKEECLMEMVAEECIPKESEIS